MIKGALPALITTFTKVQIRELPREYAKIEISRYIQQARGRKVYVSELAEELRLDIELIIEIMEELETKTLE